MHHQIAIDLTTFVVGYHDLDGILHLVIACAVILVITIRVVGIHDLASSRIKTLQGDRTFACLDCDGLGTQLFQSLLAELLALHRDVLEALWGLDGEVALNRLIFSHRVVSRLLLVQIRNVNGRWHCRRHGSSPITTTRRQSRNQQQGQPPQRHRCHTRAKRLARLHTISQHAHGIAACRALRHVRVHIAILVRTYQQVVATLAVANLAVVLVIVLDHQVGLVHIATLKRNVQVLAYALGSDVLRAKARGFVGEVVLDVGQRLDAQALAAGTHAPFASGYLDRLDGFAGVVDLQDDVLQAHDASLFPWY